MFSTRIPGEGDLHLLSCTLLWRKLRWRWCCCGSSCGSTSRIGVLFPFRHVVAVEFEKTIPLPFHFQAFEAKILSVVYTKTDYDFATTFLRLSTTFYYSLRLTTTFYDSLRLFTICLRLFYDFSTTLRFVYDFFYDFSDVHNHRCVVHYRVDISYAFALAFCAYIDLYMNVNPLMTPSSTIMEFCIVAPRAKLKKTHSTVNRMVVRFRFTCPTPSGVASSQ